MKIPYAVQIEAKLLEIHQLYLEVAELEALQKKEAGGNPKMSPVARKAKKRGKTCPVKIGDPVMVTVSGAYKGRTGRVSAVRGTMFWWINLDGTRSAEPTSIYKMRTSFMVLEK